MWNQFKQHYNITVYNTVFSLQSENATVNLALDRLTPQGQWIDENVENQPFKLIKWSYPYYNHDLPIMETQ